MCNPVYNNFYSLVYTYVAYYSCVFRYIDYGEENWKKEATECLEGLNT